MKKIKSHELKVLKQARVRGTNKIIGLDTSLDIYFVDGSKISYLFDYEKIAQEYIDDLYKITGSFKVVEKSLFD